MDRMNNLPDNVVEAILECLPVYDAVRTSALSRKWQYKWATVSRLHLDYGFFDSLYRRRKPPSISYVSLVKNIMLQHKGPLLELELYIPELGFSDQADINIIIRFALRIGVRELFLVKGGSSPQVLPSFFFSDAQQLTKLKLSNHVFDPPPVFRGIPNLKCLDLNSIKYPNFDRLSSFICSCQELRSVTLANLDNLDQHLCLNGVKLEEIYIRGRFKSISLEGIQDLVSLSLYLVELNAESVETVPCKDFMLQFFGKLSKIKSLTLGGYIFELFAVDCPPTKLPTELDHLEKITALSIDLGRVRELHCLLCLIKSSPNLQQLNVKVFREAEAVEEPQVLSQTEICADGCLEHLRTVTIFEMIGTKAELVFVEFVLGCSPVLEVMSFQLAPEIDKDAKIEVMKELMRFRRVSPKAQLLCNCD